MINRDPNNTALDTAYDAYTLLPAFVDGKFDPMSFIIKDCVQNMVSIMFKLGNRAAFEEKYGK